MPVPDSPDEAARLAALAECSVLDTPQEPAFDDLTRMAAEACQTPMAIISLVSLDRQWFKSAHGLNVCQTSRELAICSYTIRQDGPFIVPDATLDPRFRDNPLVTGEPYIRFYAGIPLTTPDGHRLGTLCVIDTNPRDLTDTQLRTLTALAFQASTQLQLRRTVARLEAAGHKLQESNAELERLRSEAESIGRAKSALLANMSHEIRTPMTAVLGYIDLLRDEADTPLSAPERAEAMSTIHRHGERLMSLVNDILDLSKIESGGIGFYPGACDASRVVGQVCASWRAEAEHHGLDLHVEDHDRPPRILADVGRVAQIVSNLIGNAIRFTPEGGRVGVRVGSRRLMDGRVEIAFRVEDTGIGMTPEQVRHLFEPFAQVDPAATRRFGGAGLGLAIAQRLAHLMGGEICVQTREGGGTSLTFTLPGTPAATSADFELSPHQHPSQASRPLADIDILLVEDCLDNQRLIKHHVAAAGARVDTALNGRLAIEATLARWHGGDAYDVVLMDMQMPELDGYAATEVLRRAGYRAPIVALTAHALIGDREKCLSAGCDDYATKPITREGLVDLCRRWAAVGTSPRAAPAASAAA